MGAAVFNAARSVTEFLILSPRIIIFQYTEIVTTFLSIVVPLIYEHVTCVCDEICDLFHCLDMRKFYYVKLLVIGIDEFVTDMSRHSDDFLTYGKEDTKKIYAFTV